MKTLSLSALALVALAAAAVAAVGCSNASDARDDVAATEGEVHASAPITLKNWRTHPKIVAVRDIVDEIDAAKYVSESKTGLCADSGHGESERTKITDDKGVVRELVLAGGSEDSAETDSYYYDAKGRLRFIFTTRNDVHGNSEEIRTYFDESGARIWDVRRHAFSPSFDADLEHAPYEAIAKENEPPLDRAVLTPAVRYDAPEQCD